MSFLPYLSSYFKNDILVIAVQLSIGEDIFRCIGEICALTIFGWEQYEMIKQDQHICDDK